MNWKGSIAWIGAVAGLAIGLLFVVLGWRAVLILLGFTAAGWALGLWIESREDVKHRLQRWIQRLFRG